jgi:signal transduction histidine kinase
MDERAPPADRLRARYDRERSARREAEAIAERVTGELFQSLQKLQSANQSLRDFVGVASHDLRGPLTSIMGFVSILRSRWGSLRDEERDEYLAIVERQGLRLNRLVDDLLTVSTIEAGAVEVRIQEIILERFVAETVLELGEAAVSVTIESAATGMVVLADPDHLRRILSNYFSNAIKYGRPPIEAACEWVDGFAEIRVRDHGPGVPAEFVPRLFERFARAVDRASDVEGTGLGLSIVQGLARANGGDAWYEPNPPSGACFAVRLPRAS